MNSKIDEKLNNLLESKEIDKNSMDYLSDYIDSEL